MAAVRYKLVKNPDGDYVEEIHKVVVHKIKMGDVDDPDLMIAQPIWDWQQTDAGRFVMENAVQTPSWERMLNPYDYHYTYLIVAELEKKKLTEYYLKFGKPAENNVAF